MGLFRVLPLGTALSNGSVWAEQDGRNLSLLLPSFILLVAVLYVECHEYGLVPDLREGRPMRKEENESEDPEQKLILPREVSARRKNTDKALREMSLLVGLPHDTLAALTPVECLVDKDFYKPVSSLIPTIIPGAKKAL